MARTSYYIVKDQEAAKDLVQDLFTKLWNDRNKLEGVSNLQGYLFTSIRNLSLNHIEKAGKDRLRQQEMAEMQVAEPFSDGNGNLSELEQRLSNAISKLPHQCRLIFSLNRFEGLTNSEIAEYLDLSKRTIETQISKALKVLREELKGVG